LALLLDQLLVLFGTRFDPDRRRRLTPANTAEFIEPSRDGVNVVGRWGSGFGAYSHPGTMTACGPSAK